MKREIQPEAFFGNIRGSVLLFKVGMGSLETNCSLGKLDQVNTVCDLCGDREVNLEHVLQWCCRIFLYTMDEKPFLNVGYKHFFFIEVKVLSLLSTKLKLPKPCRPHIRTLLSSSMLYIIGEQSEGRMWPKRF